MFVGEKGQLDVKVYCRYWAKMTAAEKLCPSSSPLLCILLILIVRSREGGEETLVNSSKLW